MDLQTIKQHDLETQTSGLIIELDGLTHHNWCQVLTRQLNIRVFPRIIRDTPHFHEVTVSIFPFTRTSLEDSTRKQIKKIIETSPETDHILFHEPRDRNVLMCHFIVRHDNHQTMLDFLNNQCDERDYVFLNIDFLESKNGLERWLFSGDTITLNNIANKAEEHNLGQILYLNNNQVTRRKTTMHYNYFHALGATKSESRVLSHAKIHKLLDDPTNKSLQRIVSDVCGIHVDKLMSILEDGVLSCSWIHGEIFAMKQKCRQKILESADSLR